jgi:hypothetical protein
MAEGPDDRKGSKDKDDSIVALPDIETAEQAPFRLPVRDRVVLHLSEFRDFIDEYEMPFTITQAGIAKTVRSHRAQVTKVLMGLKQRDYVVEKVNRVLNEQRRRKVYFLTPLGMAYSDRLREHLDKGKVLFVAHDGSEDSLSLKEVNERLGPQVSFLSLLEEAKKGKIEESSFITRLVKKGKEIEAEHIPDISTKEQRRLELEAKIEARQERTALRFIRAGMMPPPAAPPPPPEDDIMVLEDDGKPPQEIEREAVEAQGPLFERPSISSQYQAHGQVYAPAMMPYQTGYPQYPYMYPGLQVPFHLPPRRGSLYGGLAMMIVAVIFSPFLFYVGGFFTMMTIGLLISSAFLFAFYSINKRRTGRLFMDRRERRVITGCAFIMAFIGAFWMAMLAQGGPAPADALMLWTFLLVMLPLYLTLMLAKPIPANVRGGLAQSIGIFIMGLAALGFFLTEEGLVPPDYILLWILVGLGTMFIGREVHYSGLSSTLRGAMPGLGAIFFMFGSLAIWMSLTEGPAMEPMPLLTTVLWIATGVLLMAAPFMKTVKQRHLMSGLSNSLSIGVAVALLAIGLLLVYNKLYLGIVEVVLSFPVFYYGLVKLKELQGLERWRASLVLVFIVVLEVTTFFMVIQIFG